MLQLRPSNWAALHLTGVELPIGFELTYASRSAVNSPGKHPGDFSRHFHGPEIGPQRKRQPTTIWILIPTDRMQPLRENY